MYFALGLGLNNLGYPIPLLFRRAQMYTQVPVLPQSMTTRFDKRLAASTYWVQHVVDEYRFEQYTDALERIHIYQYNVESDRAAGREPQYSEYRSRYHLEEEIRRLEQSEANEDDDVTLGICSSASLSSDDQAYAIQWPRVRGQQLRYLEALRVFEEVEALPPPRPFAFLPPPSTTTVAPSYRTAPGFELTRSKYWAPLRSMWFCFLSATYLVDMPCCPFKHDSAVNGGSEQRVVYRGNTLSSKIPDIPSVERVLTNDMLAGDVGVPDATIPPLVPARTSVAKTQVVYEYLVKLVLSRLPEFPSEDQIDSTVKAFIENVYSGTGYVFDHAFLCRFFVEFWQFVYMLRREGMVLSRFTEECRRRQLTETYVALARIAYNGPELVTRYHKTGTSARRSDRRRMLTAKVHDGATMALQVAREWKNPHQYEHVMDVQARIPDLVTLEFTGTHEKPVPNPFELQASIRVSCPPCRDGFNFVIVWTPYRVRTRVLVVMPRVYWTRMNQVDVLLGVAERQRRTRRHPNSMHNAGTLCAYYLHQHMLSDRVHGPVFPEVVLALRILTASRHFTGTTPDRRTMFYFIARINRVLCLLSQPYIDNVKRTRGKSVGEHESVCIGVVHMIMQACQDGDQSRFWTILDTCLTPEVYNVFWCTVEQPALRPKLRYADMTTFMQRMFSTIRAFDNRDVSTATMHLDDAEIRQSCKRQKKAEPATVNPNTFNGLGHADSDDEDDEDIMNVHALTDEDNDMHVNEGGLSGEDGSGDSVPSKEMTESVGAAGMSLMTEGQADSTARVVFTFPKTVASMSHNQGHFRIFDELLSVTPTEDLEEVLFSLRVQPNRCHRSRKQYLPPYTRAPTPHHVVPELYRLSNVERQQFVDGNVSPIVLLACCLDVVPTLVAQQQRASGSGHLSDSDIVENVFALAYRCVVDTPSANVFPLMNNLVVGSVPRSMHSDASAETDTLFVRDEARPFADAKPFMMETIYTNAYEYVVDMFSATEEQHNAERNADVW